MLAGRANDIKKHRWFEGLDWEALEARKVQPPRIPKEKDAQKRLQELTVSHTVRVALRYVMFMSNQLACAEEDTLTIKHKSTVCGLFSMHAASVAY